MSARDDLQGLFGRRVRAERERLGYSQEQFAHVAHLDRTYISGVERGARNITLRVVSQIASALGLAPSDLLRHDNRTDRVGPTYRTSSSFSIHCGFAVRSSNIVAAIHQTNAVAGALPMSLFTTVDLKTQSGMIGAIFAAELAEHVGAIPNPIEKGHPDIVPVSAASASEADLRNYKDGLEIKCTLGQVTKGSGLGAGEERVRHLSGIVWQAHHRDVRSLMGLVWDFVEGRRSTPRHPVIAAVFFSDRLQEDDWGAIAGTTGRNTKVTGMTVSGRRKMAAGAIALISDPMYADRYAACLGVSDFATLDRTE